MLYAITKALLSGAIIATASEVAKRNPGLGAIILSLPLVSLLAFVWLWLDTGDKEAIATLSRYLLVRLADAADVPAASGAPAERHVILARAGHFLQRDSDPLSVGRVGFS